MPNNRTLLIISGVIIWAISAKIAFAQSPDTTVGIIARLIFGIPFIYLMFFWPLHRADTPSDPMLGRKVEVIEKFIEKNGEFVGFVKYHRERWSAVLEPKCEKPDIGDLLEIVRRNGNIVYVKSKNYST